MKKFSILKILIPTLLLIISQSGCGDGEKNSPLSDKDTIPVQTIQLKKEEVQRSVATSG